MGTSRSLCSGYWVVIWCVVSCTGCTGGAPQNAAEESPVAGASAVDDHSGWWCREHGVPEQECSLCSSRAAERFKTAGDWCEEHHRAQSQCFVCDPDRAERYRALYRAKYGEDPPALDQAIAPATPPEAQAPAGAAKD